MLAPSAAGNSPRVEPEMRVLPDPDLLDYLVNRAVDRVDERLQRREERRKRFLAVAISILSAIGVTVASIVFNSLIDEKFASFRVEMEQGIQRSAEGLAKRQGTFETEIDARFREFKDSLAKSLSTSFAEEAQHSSTLREKALQAQQAELAHIQSALRGEAQQKAQQAVATEIGGIRTQVADAVDYQQLALAAVSLDLSAAVGRAETKEILRMLRLVSTNPNLLNRPDFVSILKKVLVSFAAAGIKQPIREIETLFPSQLKQDESIVLALVLHYGQQLIGDARPPSELRDDVVRFKSYVEVAKGYDDVVVPTVLEILLEVKTNGFKKSHRSDSLFRTVADFSPEQTMQFLRQLQVYRDPSEWLDQPTPLGQRVAEACEAVLESYRKEISEIGGSFLYGPPSEES